MEEKGSALLLDGGRGSLKKSKSGSEGRHGGMLMFGGVIGVNGDFLRILKGGKAE